jgi:holo-[acyl-carrier protein] synthase
VILCTGVDLVEIDRFRLLKEDILKRFLQRVFTALEMEQMKDSLETVAGRFAAKEAVVKALGSGIGDVVWHDVQILSDDQGAPHVELLGKASVLAQSLHLTQWSLSISHTRVQAIAFVVAMGE